MSKFHSTISRRDFMKALGLAGAGLGAAAAVAPVFHGLDEFMASPQAVRKLPWWVKEREFNNPTVEIDWDVMQKFDMRNAYDYFTPDMAEDVVQQHIATMKDGIINKRPGMMLKDWGVLQGLVSTQLRVDLTIPEPILNYTSAGTTKPWGYTREDLDMPRWEGTPEDNLRMCAAAIHFFGGREIGAIELDEKSKKLFYSYIDAFAPPHLSDKFGCGGRAFYKPLRFEDVDEPSETQAEMVLPNKARWMVIFTVPQSALTRNNYVTMGKFGVYGGYSDGAVLMTRVQAFLRTLGYLAINKGAGFGSSLGSNSGFGVLAGNGELGRHDFVVSPKYGSFVRMTEFFLTDLPLAPTKPIDAGIWRFCNICNKCGETCPSGAILQDDEPTWETSGPWNGGGRKCYPIDYQKCRPWRGAPGHIADAGSGGCSNCQASCVFSKTPNASIHDVIKPIVATTSLFNSFFKTMDDAFGYGKGFVSPLGEVFVDPEEWWNRDLNTYPFKGRVIGDGWE